MGMTVSKNKNGLMTKLTCRLLTALLILSCVSCVLALNVQTAFAEDSTTDVFFTVYMADTPNGEDKLVKSYTEEEFEALIPKDAEKAGYIFSSSSTYKLNVTTNYVTVDALLADAGITFSSGMSITVKAADGFGSSETYSEYVDNAFFYSDFNGNTGSGRIDMPDGLNAVIALKYTQYSFNDTAAGTLLQNHDPSSETDDQCPRFFTASSESTVEKMGRTSPANCVSITVTPNYGRLSGSSRYSTMESVINEGYTNVGTTIGQRIIVASGKNFPDALAASAYAGVSFDSGKYTYADPIVLTASGSLSDSAANAITDLRNKTNPNTAEKDGYTGELYQDVVIIGGTAAISQKVEDQIASLVGADHVSRVSGDNRYETALALYEDGQKYIDEQNEANSGNDYWDTLSWSDTCILASGTKYADSLSASSLAYANNIPIFFTNAKSGIKSSVYSEITSGAFSKAIILGGKSAVSSSDESKLKKAGLSVERIGGDDRYETCSLIVDYAIENYENMSYSTVAVASGKDFPDALSASSFAGMNEGLILLVSSSSNGSYCIGQNLYINAEKVVYTYVIGGKSAVSESLYKKVMETIY